MSDIKAIQTVMNAAILNAVAKGLHTGNRVLLVLTEIEPNTRYGYESDDISFPHTIDGQLVLPLGINKKGQREFLISLDTSGLDDPSHPDPSVPAGWDWKIYEEEKPKKTEPILIVLTRTDKTLQAESKPEEVKGFSMLRLPPVAGHEQYALLIDAELFTCQIRSM